MNEDVLVRIGGDVEQPLEFSHADFAAFAEEQQVRDVSRLDSRRQGDGVTLTSVIERVRPKTSATHLTLRSSLDGFAASIPLDAVRDRGILIYQVGNRPLQQVEVTASAGSDAHHGRCHHQYDPLVPILFQSSFSYS